jgi:hypothetical protein
MIEIAINVSNISNILVSKKLLQFVTFEKLSMLHFSSELEPEPLDQEPHRLTAPAAQHV